MNREKREREREIKILIVDVIMAIAVVGIVGVLVAIVAGWRFGENMTLEQNGLVQINSMPTGAKVTVDGEASSGNTNTSVMLPGGEHTITLTREGYESWSKVVTVTPGWLLNLQYPRLFKQGRTKESVKVLDGLTMLSVAPDRKSLIYVENDSAEWNYMSDIGGEKPKISKVNLAEFATTVEVQPENPEDEIETREVINVSNVVWNVNGDRILVKTKDGDFLLVDLKKPEDSLNISEAIVDFKNYETLTRGLEERVIQKIAMTNNAGTELFARIDGSLFKVSVTEKTIEMTPVLKISDFNVLDSEVIYVTEPNEKGLRFIGLYKDGDKTVQDFYKAEVESDVLQVGLSEYYGQKYVIFSVGPRLYVYRGAGFNKDDMKKVAENDTWITPESLEVSQNGEFFVLRNGTKVVVYDAEIEKWTEYEYVNKRNQWLDKYIMFGVEGGMLKAWDFDGSNVRTLVVDDAAEGFDATVTANDKYFYYVAKNEAGFELRREKL